MTLLFSLFVGAVLVLSGIGLGTVGATVIGMSKLADLRKQAGGARCAGGVRPGAGGGGGLGRNPGRNRGRGRVAPSRPQEPGVPPRRRIRPGIRGVTRAEERRQTLGVEAVDAPDGRPGALLVGVHVPGPGYTAGLVRGDVLLAFGRTRVDSAADLARAVAAARPGTAVTLTLRHASGGYQQLSVTPGVVT